MLKFLAALSLLLAGLTRAHNLSDASQRNFGVAGGARGSATFYWLRSSQELVRAANWLRSSHQLAGWGCGAMQRHKFLGEAAEAPEIKRVSFEAACDPRD